MKSSDFFVRFTKRLEEKLKDGTVGKAEFYDHKYSPTVFHHEKMVKIVCKAIEDLGYESLTGPRARYFTMKKSLQQLKTKQNFVPDAIGYKINPRDPPSARACVYPRIIVEYESIDSWYVDDKKKKERKISKYVERMLEIEAVELYVMIAIFTTTVTKRKGDRNRKEHLYRKVRDDLERIARRAEGSSFALISIFDNEICCEAFIQNEWEKPDCRPIEISPPPKPAK